MSQQAAAGWAGWGKGAQEEGESAGSKRLALEKEREHAGPKRVACGATGSGRAEMAAAAPAMIPHRAAAMLQCRPLCSTVTLTVLKYLIVSH